MATPGSSFTPTPLGHEDNLGTRPVAMPYLRGITDIFFPQDNARPHFALQIFIYFDTEGIQLLSWLARSTDHDPLKIFGYWLLRDGSPLLYIIYGLRIVA
ncbi:hypothetical protein TNCV_4913021 [Trichonephila clavipes]|nr:hypothetical protein TNCV_4913021 [Trichonephila clavipes]